MWFGALIPLDPIPASRCHGDPYPTRREAQIRTLSVVGHATTSKHAFETVSEGGVFCSLLVRGVMGRAFTVHSGFELLHVLVSGLFSIFLLRACGLRYAMWSELERRSDLCPRTTLDFIFTSMSYLLTRAQPRTATRLVVMRHP